jgi:hypothetical protein
MLWYMPQPRLALTYQTRMSQHYRPLIQPKPSRQQFVLVCRALRHVVVHAATSSCIDISDKNVTALSVTDKTKPVSSAFCPGMPRFAACCGTCRALRHVVVHAATSFCIDISDKNVTTLSVTDTTKPVSSASCPGMPRLLWYAALCRPLLHFTALCCTLPYFVRCTRPSHAVLYHSILYSIVIVTQLIFHCYWYLITILLSTL